MKLCTSFILPLILAGCTSSKVPTQRLLQYEYDKSYAYFENRVEIDIKNPLKCPLRIWISCADNELQKKLNLSNPIVLMAESDTTLVYESQSDKQSEITFASRLGDVRKEIQSIEIGLPYPEEREYKVIQGNNTNYTHNTDLSRYAVDFNLKVNDTICAATNGFVVGVIDQYKYGGPGNEWKLFGNYITIYEPISGIFTQYVHLTKNGSFVKVGDEIKRGQAIGLSGKTGQTNIEHLHFNCLIPVNSQEGLESIPFKFMNGHKSVELEKGNVLKR